MRQWVHLLPVMLVVAWEVGWEVKRKIEDTEGPVVRRVAIVLLWSPAW